MASGAYDVVPWASRSTSRPSGDRQARAVLGRERFRFEDGKVVELWNHRDDLGLMQQLRDEIFAGAAPEQDEEPSA